MKLTTAQRQAFSRVLALALLGALVACGESNSPELTSPLESAGPGSGKTGSSPQDPERGHKPDVQAGTDTPPAVEPGTGPDPETEAGAEIKPDVIAKSAIFFTSAAAASEANVETYKANGLFWGHMPNNYANGKTLFSDEAMADWADAVQGHLDRGVSYTGRIEFDWGWRWMIDFMDHPGDYWAIDFNGKQIKWGAGEMHGGEQANWQSHHGPEFPEWLKWQVDRLLLGPVTHIMFDSQTSSTRTLRNQGGDFSPHALSGFREYLRDKFTPLQLTQMGVNNIETFDFLAHLKGLGYDMGKYKTCVGDVQSAQSLPLCGEFVFYQRERLNEVMDEALEHIQAKRPGMPVGAATSLMEPRGYVFSDLLTYMVGEYSHDLGGDLSRLTTNPVGHLKEAEFSGKPLMYAPYPWAWQDIRDAGVPRHARMWIAQSYAMGGIFTVPVTIWMGGSEGWEIGEQNIAPVYQFIREHEALFDEYLPASKVGYIVPVAANMNWGMDGGVTIRESTEKLVLENLAFDYLLFGDPGRPFAPSAQKLEQYDVLVSDSELWRLDAMQQQLLSNATPDIVSVDDLQGIISRSSGRLSISAQGKLANDQISALPRIGKEKAAPYVVHLLNRRHDLAADRPVTHQAVSLTIPKNHFSEEITGITLHMVEKDSVNLEFTKNAQGDLVLELGDFDRCWGIVELEH